MKLPSWSWSQPACDDCWYERNPHRTPVRLHEPRREFCVWCGEETRTGIYVRIDPVEAPFPTVPSDS